MDPGGRSEREISSVACDAQPRYRPGVCWHPVQVDGRQHFCRKSSKVAPQVTAPVLYGGQVFLFGLKCRLLIHSQQPS